MKEINEQFQNAAQQVVLSAQEKASIKAGLVRHMHTPTSVPSPFMRLWQFSKIVHVQYATVAIVALIVCGGVSGFAEGSLPGEPLYQVKTSVNENIRGLFAFTPQSKAQLHVELAVRRLEEAQELASTGKLQDGLKVEVEQKIDEHLAVIKDSLLALEKDTATTTVATTTATTTDISDDSVATTTVSIDLASSTDAGMVDGEVVVTQTFALKELMSTSTASSTLESKIKDASDSLKEGGDKVNSEDYSGAYSSVQKAEKATEDIKTILNDTINVTATSTSPKVTDMVSDQGAAVITADTASSTATSSIDEVIINNI